MKQDDLKQQSCCPKCDAPVEADTKECPYCHYIFKSKEYLAKQAKRNKIIKRIFMVAFTVVFIVLLFFAGNYLNRGNNIRKDLESVYTEAEIVSLECALFPIDKKELEEDYRWIGTELPEETLYEFRIMDANGDEAEGYATFSGKVIVDSYASEYYKEDMIASLEAVLDFEHNFPELGYYIDTGTIVNEFRLVSTHDCTTFEGYKTARCVGYRYWVHTGGYPVVELILDDVSEETLEAIEEALVDKEFDLYVEFVEAENDLSEVNDSMEITHGSTYGFYCPYDENYDKAVLGN